MFVSVVVIAVLQLRKKQTDYALQFCHVPPPTNLGPIPHHLHQSWKTHTLPKKFDRWHASWLQLHPHWNVTLWSDADNDNFVKTHYPWFFPTYSNFPRKIMQVDSVRYLYLYHYGGVYADLDVKALKNLDPLLANHHGVLFSELGEPQFDNNIPNAWMASAPKHPFWLCLIGQIMQTDRQFLGLLPIAEMVAGPIVLTNTVLYYQRLHKQPVMDILPMNDIYPYSWHNKTHPHVECSSQRDTFNETLCDAHFTNAYTITYWSHSWDVWTNAVTKTL